MSKEEIAFISQNQDGNWYIGYKVKVQRGIKGKTKSKVDELLIVGIPESKFDDFCKREGLHVEKQNIETGEIIIYG